MTDPVAELMKHLLERLMAVRGQILAAGKFKPSVTVLKELSADASHVQAARDQLLQRQFITQKKAGGGSNFQLTPAGEAHLKTLEPQPPETNPTLFPFQKSFILLKFFVAKGNRKAQNQFLSRADLEKKLSDGKEVFRYLEFGPIPEDPDSNVKLKPDGRLVGWILETLVKQDALEVQRRGRSVKYHITEAGEELLAASDQYPTVTLNLQLTGRAFNRLREAIRRSLNLAGTPPPVPTVEPPSAQAAELPASPALTPDIVLRTFNELRREAYSGTGLVPIHDLRTTLAGRCGPEAARHETLDQLLMRLDREDRVRLVSIGDRSRATAEQLADSIPGDNETFFYVEAIHEHASIG